MDARRAALCCDSCRARGPIAARSENFGGRDEAGSQERKCVSIRGNRNAFVERIFHDFPRRASGRCRDFVHRLLRFIYRREVNFLAVRRPNDFIHAAIEGFGNFGVRACRRGHRA